MTHDEIVDLAPAYVLGALEADEELLVAEHLATCHQDHSEFSELGSVVPYLDEQVPLVEPPAALRQRIMAAAAGDLANRPADGRARRGTVVSFDTARRRPIDIRGWAVGIAAVLAIVALGALNVLTQQQLAAARDFQARTTEALQLANQPGTQVALLVSAGGTPNGPSGIAVMPPSGSGRLLMSGLAATTGGQVYEAWAIAEGAAPTPLGSFTVGSDGIGYFDRMPSSSGETLTVAITLESRPDPPGPTTPVLSSGVTVPSGG